SAYKAWGKDALPDEELFLCSMFASQRGEGDLIYAGRTDRKDRLVELLGFGYLERLAEACRNRIRSKAKTGEEPKGFEVDALAADKAVALSAGAGEEQVAAAASLLDGARTALREAEQALATIERQEKEAREATTSWAAARADLVTRRATAQGDARAAAGRREAAGQNRAGAAARRRS